MGSEMCIRDSMVIVHKKNVNGTDADAATVSRFSQYAKRGPRTRAQSTADAQPTPDANADDPRPSTSARSSIPTRRRRRLQKSIAVVPQSPTISLTDTQPAATSFDVADDLILSLSSTDTDVCSNSRLVSCFTDYSLCNRSTFS